MEANLDQFVETFKRKYNPSVVDIDLDIALNYTVFVQF